MKQYFDENEIRKAIAIMKADDQLYEIRIHGGTKKIISGYFRGADKLIAELKKLRKQDLDEANIYISLNKINDACYDRKQRDVLRTYNDATTSDTDVVGYDWLMVDLDPVRPKDTSSTASQIEKAKQKANKIYEYMTNLGFEKPLVAESGNGVHLLYKLAVANTEERKALLKDALTALDVLFSDNEISVDKVNHNPSRICKLYGTLAQKGSDSEERPHRMSRIVSCPAELKTTDVAYLQKLADEIPKMEDKPQRYNGYNPSEFDLDDWMNKHGVNYRKENIPGKVKYVLDHCPFNSNHKGKDACVFKTSNGVIFFKCFHNSCADKHWQDFRLLYEPDAYEKRRAYEEKRTYGYHNRDDKKPEPTKLEKVENKPVWLTPKDIANKPRQPERFMKTGIQIFDKKFRGLRYRGVTILSGYTGGAKSTLLSQIILNAVDAGNHVACFSGELADDDFMRWVHLQAAGKNYVEPTDYEGYCNVPKETQNKINEWMTGKFWLYENEYGYNYGAIMQACEEAIDQNKIDLLCLDNLMAFDITEISDKEIEAQTKFIWNLHMLAMNKNIHVILVAHPRKQNGLLRKFDIAGSSNIINAVDNIIFCYRVNQEFMLDYKMFFNTEYNRGYDGRATNCIHCDKARFGSVDDDYIPLYYDMNTKRIGNAFAENVTYGWCDDFDVSEETPFD